MKKPQNTTLSEKGVRPFGHKPFKNKIRTCTPKSSKQNNLYIELVINPLRTKFVHSKIVKAEQFIY